MFLCFVFLRVLAQAGPELMIALSHLGSHYPLYSSEMKRNMERDCPSFPSHTT